MPARRRQRLVHHLAAVSMLFALLVGAPIPAALAQAPTEPATSARAGIVVDYASGRILYSKSMHDRLAPASTTKIMTAILAMEYGKLDSVFTATDNDLVGESTMGLEVGEHETLRNLLYGMLLPSGNDAAMVIARGIGSDIKTTDPTLSDPVARFVAMMNLRAQQFGLGDTHFLDPHGLDRTGHVSSAYDLASMTWYALHLQFFDDIVRQVSYDVPGHPLMNTNEILTRYPGADGVKTGWTDDGGLCLVTSATRDGHRLISVVMNDPKWYDDSAAMLDFGFATLAARPLDSGAEVLGIVARANASWLLVNAGNPESVPVLSQEGQGGAPAALKPASSPVALQPDRLASSAARGAAAGQAAKEGPLAPVLAGRQQLHSPSSDDLRSGGGGTSPDSLLESRAAIAAGSGASSAVVNAGPATLGASRPGAYGGWWWPAAATLALALAGLGVRVRRPRVPLLVRAVSDVAPPVLAPDPASGVLSRSAAVSSRGENAGDMWLTPDEQPRAVPQAPPDARTLGRPPVPRRREPNLLSTPGQERDVHILRALTLAGEGREGTAMSEFLAAIRAGAALDVSDLASRYRLSGTAFLALSRAQLAAGMRDEARQTLLHGALVMPQDRILLLALRQLQRGGD